MKKIVVSILSIVALSLTVPATVLAHVVVKPSQVAPGAFQTFTTGVPNEKDQPTIKVRLVIPDGLKHVSPNVKPGWEVKITKSGEEASVTELEWSGGSVPVGFRDEFNFSAQAPASDTTLIWKAYQTYQDGTVVSWDQAPSETEGSTPYSETKVAQAETPDQTTKTSSSTKGDIALALGGLALLIAVAGILRKK